MYIWQEARAFVNNVYGMMAKCNDYGFRDQMQRAAVSIMNNIAEGSESGYDAKFIHFLHIAKGSCGEVKSMLYLCEDFNICTTEQRTELQSQLKNLLWNYEPHKFPQKPLTHPIDQINSLTQKKLVDLLTR